MYEAGQISDHQGDFGGLDHSSRVEDGENWSNTDIV